MERPSPAGPPAAKWIGGRRSEGQVGKFVSLQVGEGMLPIIVAAPINRYNAPTLK
jgi:hypothetical protein